MNSPTLVIHSYGRRNIRTMRVLVVDDDALAQVIAEGRARGYDCTVATSGCRGQEDRTESFDVILTDLKMACGRLEQQGPGQATRGQGHRHRFWRWTRRAGNEKAPITFFLPVELISLHHRGQVGGRLAA